MCALKFIRVQRYNKRLKEQNSLKQITDSDQIKTLFAKIKKGARQYNAWRPSNIMRNFY